MNSTYWTECIMKTMFSNMPVPFYLGLSKTIPNADGTGVSEPSTEDYQRAAIMKMTDPHEGTVSNAEKISFARSGQEWFGSDTPAICWVMFDGKSNSANVLAFGMLNEGTSIAGNTIASIPAGALTFSLTQDN